MFGFWLLLGLFLLLLIAGPWWPYSRGWGYFPVVVVLVLLLFWLLLIWLGWVAVLFPWAPGPPPPGIVPPAG
jgi:hypothetical protein